MQTDSSTPDTPEPDDTADDAVIGVALKWSLGIVSILGCVAAVTLWWLTRPEPEPEMVERTLVVPTIRERPQVEIPDLPFTDITEQAGIHFVHQNGAAGEKLLPETMGGGCGFVDVDADGDQDIVLVNGCRWPWEQVEAADTSTPALYLNDGSGMFTDATAGSGLDVTFYGTGLAAADYDGDGLTDLFIASVGPDRLFRNLGGGRFEDVTATAGVAGGEDAWGSSCGFFDYDRDGDLDAALQNRGRDDENDQQGEGDIDQARDVDLGIERKVGTITQTSATLASSSGHQSTARRRSTRTTAVRGNAI